MGNKRGCGLYRTGHGVALAEATPPKQAHRNGRRMPRMLDVRPLGGDVAGPTQIVRPQASPRHD
ncbi:hypothetical protein FA13DRAFT_1725454 [Coprinellus micaceus]|uniref:Uncharacterized protein n=1 Tax=Coprinellus micaceus TaxID=71717 RepID=A0A4Y7TV09_COPMI|nr:hypothetical protein FA13DRAFT_1725454 [Coprinellus micaceus]